MIRVLTDLPQGVLGFQATGKLTADDYTSVLAPALDAVSARSGRIRVLLEFVGEFDGMDRGAAWQDMKMGARDWSAWERIALVTDHPWMREGLTMFAWAVPGEAKAFPGADRQAALDWLSAP